MTFDPKRHTWKKKFKPNRKEDIVNVRPKERDLKRDEKGRVIGIEKKGTACDVVQIAEFWEFLEKGAIENKRIMCLYGGGRSGKSYSIRQYLVDLAERHKEVGIEILIVMKTRASLKHAAWEPMLEMLDNYGVEYSKHETLYIITMGKSHIVMGGLDDPEKIKSTEWTMIWIEEATRLDPQDYLQLKVRLSRPGPVPNQIFLSFNPVSISNWCMTDIVLKAATDPSIAVMHSTYDMNPFVDDEYVADIEAMKDVNHNMWLIYARGEAALLDKIIYGNWDVIDWIQVPMAIRERKKNPDAYGHDAGFTHPLHLCGYWECEGEDYVLELIHASKMTTEDMMKKMEEIQVDKGSELFCPPEQPGVIEMLCSRGYNAKPVPSEYRSVKDGIDYCKGRKLHIIAPSENIIKEIMGYSYQEKKDGTPLETPLKFQDDAMDAMRYARASLRGRYQGYTAAGRDNARGDILTRAMEEGIWQREHDEMIYQ